MHQGGLRWIEVGHRAPQSPISRQSSRDANASAAYVDQGPPVSDWQTELSAHGAIQLEHLRRLMESHSLRHARRSDSHRLGREERLIPSAGDPGR